MIVKKEAMCLLFILMLYLKKKQTFETVLYVLYPDDAEINHIKLDFILCTAEYNIPYDVLHTGKVLMIRYVVLTKV